MARKPMAAKQPATSNAKKKRVNRKKETQPRTPMQRVQVMGPTGKLRMEWRPWGS